MTTTDFENQADALVTDFNKTWSPIPYQPPSELFHYCGVDGMRGILTKQEIWLSNIEFLNDVSEHLYTELLLREELRARLSTATGWTEMVLTFLMEAAGFTTNGIYRYAACFCEKNDVLSQWRGYGGTGGYAIGLDLRDLAQPPGEPTIPYLTLKVIYDRTEQVRLMREAMDRYLPFVMSRQVEAWWKSDPTEANRAAISSRFMRLTAPLFASFKDAAWSEEAEWRLVALTGSHNLNNVEFRSRAGMVVPYRIYPFVKDGGRKLPITRVLIGPVGSAGSDITARNSLAIFLRSLHLDKVPIQTSKVPIRFY